MIILAVLAAVVAVAVGCNGTQQKSASLEGTSWKLAGWAISSQNPADFTITADFDAASISGKSVINQYNGSYTTSDGDKVEFGPIAMTKMAGSEDEMRAEQNYHQLLSQSKKYEVKDNTLTLMDESGNQLLIFEKVR